MADPQVHRLLSSLEATFQAAVTRQEEEAAFDLAFSLAQDQTLQEVLLRNGSLRLLLDGGEALPVATVGIDYVVAGTPPRVTPSRSAAFVIGGEGKPPRHASTSFLVMLRRWARSRVPVAVLVHERTYTGDLIQATPDYLTLDAPTGRLIIGIGAVREIRLISGGSAGEL